MFIFQSTSSHGVNAQKPLKVTDDQLNAIAGNKDWTRNFGISPVGIGAAVVTAMIFSNNSNKTEINSKNAVEYFIAACEYTDKGIMRNAKAAAVIANIYWNEICEAYPKNDRMKFAWDKAWQADKNFREDIVSRRCSLDNASGFLKEVANGIGSYCDGAIRRANSEGATFGNISRRFLTPGGWVDGLMWLPYNGVINLGAALGYGDFRAETPPYGTMMSDLGKGIWNKVSGGKWYDVAQAPLYFLADLTSIPAWVEYSSAKKKLINEPHVSPVQINLVSNQYMQAWADAAFTATIVGGISGKIGKNVGEKLVFGRARLQTENYIIREAERTGVKLGGGDAKNYANSLIDQIEKEYFASGSNAGRLFMPQLDKKAYQMSPNDWYFQMRKYNQYKAERSVAKGDISKSNMELGEYISAKIAEKSKLMAAQPFGKPFPITGMVVQVPSLGKTMVKGVVESAKTIKAWTVVTAERTFAIPVRKLSVLEGYGPQMNAWLDGFKNSAVDKMIRREGVTATKPLRKTLEGEIDAIILQGEAGHSRAVVNAFNKDFGFAGSLDMGLSTEISTFKKPSSRIVGKMQDNLTKYYMNNPKKIGEGMSLEAQVEFDIFNVLNSAVKDSFVRIRGEMFRIYKVGFTPAPLINDGYITASLRDHVLKTTKTNKFESLAQMLSRTQFNGGLLQGAAVKEAATLRELGKATTSVIKEVILDPLKLPALDDVRKKLTVQRAGIEERIRANSIIIQRIGAEEAKNPLVYGIKKLETQQKVLKERIASLRAKKNSLGEHDAARRDAFDKVITENEKRLDEIGGRIKETKKKIAEQPEIKANQKKQAALAKENEALNDCSRYLLGLEGATDATRLEILKAYVKTSYNSFMARGFEGAPGWLGKFDQWLAKNNLKGNYAALSREIDELGKGIDVVRGRINKQYDAWRAARPTEAPVPKGSSLENEFINEMYSRAGGKVKDEAALATVKDIEALSKLAPERTYRSLKLAAIIGAGITAIGGVGALVWFYPKQVAEVGLAVGLTAADFYALGVSTKLAGGEDGLLGLITAFSAAQNMNMFAGGAQVSKSMETSQAAGKMGLTTAEQVLYGKIFTDEQMIGAFNSVVYALSSVNMADDDPGRPMEDARNTIRVLLYVQKYMERNGIPEPNSAVTQDLGSLGQDVYRQTTDVPQFPADRQAQLQDDLKAQQKPMSMKNAPRVVNAKPGKIVEVPLTESAYVMLEIKGGNLAGEYWFKEGENGYIEPVDKGNAQPMKNLKTGIEMEGTFIYNLYRNKEDTKPFSSIIVNSTK